MIVKQLIKIKIMATILCLFVAGLHEYAVACSSFSIPYALAVMFDDTISEKFGFFIVVSLGIYTVVWIVSPVLLAIRNQCMHSIGIYLTVALNVCDLICCFLSLVEFPTIAKVINLAFSLLIILVACTHFSTGRSTV